MKKTLLASMFAFAMAAAPLSSHAVQTIDSPHLNLDGDAGTEDCSYCHFDFTMAVTSAYPCQTCHDDVDAMEVQTHMEMNCETCHNPHVSLQYQGDGTNAMVIASGLVATDNFDGTVTFDNGDAGATPINTTFRDAAFTDAATWSAKTANTNNAPDLSRGLMLWAAGTSGDNYSFEVVGATDNQIMVSGALPAGDTLGSDVELHYGQLIAQKISSNTNYRDGASDVAFNGSFVETGTATPTGVCQVCHDSASPTAVTHWRSDGTNTVDALGNHDGVNNLDCTRCHNHKPGFGKNGLGKDFTECNICHGWPPATGMHELHASKYTCDTTGELFPDDLTTCNTKCAEAGGTCSDNGNYGFSCASCHKGGMEDWHSAPYEDDLLQIGFANTEARFNGLNFGGILTEYDGTATPAYPYEGRRDTAITAVNNDMSCSGIYCHSNGLASRQACSTATDSDSPSNPPTWDNPNWDPQGDGNSCNNCHGDNFTDNASDTHWSHMVKPATMSLPNLKCVHCHYGTAALDAGDNNIIADKSLHVNGIYEVQSSTSNVTWNGSNVSFNYQQIGGSFGCTTTCHPGRYWSKKQDTCPTVDPATVSNVDPIAESMCEVLDSNTLLIHNQSSVDEDYLDAAKNVALGGGHDASPGLIKVYYLHMTNTDLEDYQYVTLQDTPAPPYAFTHYWKPEDLYVDPADGRPYAYFEFKMADNSPGSVDNMFANTPGGWDADDGNIPSLPNWRRCAMDTYDPTQNQPVHYDWSVAKTAYNTITITDRSVDPDYNDASKGHNGATNAYILAFYFTDDETPGGTPGGGANGGGSYHLSDVAVDQDLPPFTYDDGDLDYDSRPGERLAWYVLEYYDNHYIDIDSTTPIARTGWQYFNILP